MRRRDDEVVFILQVICAVFQECDVDHVRLFLKISNARAGNEHEYATHILRRSFDGLPKVWAGLWYVRCSHDHLVSRRICCPVIPPGVRWEVRRILGALLFDARARQTFHMRAAIVTERNPQPSPIGNSRVLIHHSTPIWRKKTISAIRSGPKTRASPITVNRNILLRASSFIVSSFPKILPRDRPTLPCAAQALLSLCSSRIERCLRWHEYFWQSSSLRSRQNRALPQSTRPNQSLRRC